LLHLLPDLAVSHPDLRYLIVGDGDDRPRLQAKASALGVAPRVIFAGQIPRAKSNGMASMLRALGLELVGTHHRGIDDCHNIARIALALAARGAAFRITAKLAGSRYPELPLTLEWQGTTHAAVLKKRSLRT